MAIFNIKDQKVENQYNAETINIEQNNNIEDFLSHIKQLQRSIEENRQSKLISNEQAKEITCLVHAAKSEAKKKSPNKNSIIENLKLAGQVLSSVDKITKAISLLILKAGELFS